MKDETSPGRAENGAQDWSLEASTSSHKRFSWTLSGDWKEARGHVKDSQFVYADHTFGLLLSVHLNSLHTAQGTRCSVVTLNGKEIQKREDIWIRLADSLCCTAELLPGKFHGWRSLVGCGPWGHKESDTTEWLHFHLSLLCIGEGNGNPLQCSCLENPRRGAWRAAVHGVTQSWTRLSD